MIIINILAFLAFFVMFCSFVYWLAGAKPPDDHL